MRPTTQLRASQASDKLTVALLTIGSRGLRTPCSDVAVRNYWVSELQPERRQAARWCVEWECPVLQPCLEAAQLNDERHGVWGGRDMTRRPGRPRTDAA